MRKRTFLKAIGAAAATAVAGRESAAAVRQTGSGMAPVEPVAVLVDTTRCIGCRSCEEACAKENGLPVPDTSEPVPVGSRRTPSDTQWTVLNAFGEKGAERYVKQQCMHCLQPACASACLTKALVKTPEGPVVWRGDRCMGCRFCMISCPFDMPRFEYGSANPKIQKCQLCFARAKQGKKPACVEECLGDALVFGKRSELLAEARRRIAKDPDKYHAHIYGEHEAGGTSWLYLSATPIPANQFPANVEDMSYPELSKGFLYSVPVVLTLWPAFLLALHRSTERPQETENVEQSEDVTPWTDKSA